MATAAPSRARASAMARPMPRPPPVTRAVVPLRVRWSASDVFMCDPRQQVQRQAALSLAALAQHGESVAAEFYQPAGNGAIERAARRGERIASDVLHGGCSGIMTTS